MDWGYLGACPTHSQLGALQTKSAGPTLSILLISLTTQFDEQTRLEFLFGTQTKTRYPIEPFIVKTRPVEDAGGTNSVD